MQNTPELWLPIQGYEGIYEISNLGRVARIKNGERFVRKINTATVYPSICFLKREIDKTQKSATVHSLVASAFLGPRPSGSIIRHLDGNRYNSKADNLAYGTPAENTIDAVKHGTYKRVNNGRALLNDRGVLAIKMLITHGVSLSEIARGLDISVSTVHAIKTGRNWA